MTYLRFLIFAAFAASTFALTPKQNATLEQYSKPCRDEVGVTPDEIDKGLNGQEQVEDAKLKAQVFCVLKKIDIISAEGDLNVEKLKGLAKLVAASDEEAEKIVTKCAVKRDTPEETSFRTIRCLHEKWPQFSPVE